MKVKITETREEERATPFFTHNGADYHAFLSETEQITVTFQEYKYQPPSVWIYYHTMIERDAAKPLITQKEFEDAFVRASDKLSEVFEKMRDAEKSDLTVSETGMLMPEDLQDDKD